MALYSLGQRLDNPATGGPLIQYVAGANAFRVVEFSYVSIGTGGTLGLALGRPAAAGISPSGSLFQADNPSEPASTATGAMTWGTAPTSPTVFLRRASQPNAVGTGILWTFPKGLVIRPSESFVLWSIVVFTPIGDVNCVIEE